MFVCIDEIDCVVTCFFLETAENVLAYLDRINRILKVGGLWVNFGPLENSKEPCQKRIELSAEELLEIIPKYGFKFKKHNEFK